MLTTAEKGTALITGASSGIGAATARAFGAQGWRVALGARREERLAEVAREVEKAGGSALAAHLDVTDPASIDAFYGLVEDALGAPDVVVSNAGMSILNRLHEAAVEDLRYEITVNLLGPMWLARRAIPGMLARRAGDLIFVTSENAVRPRPYQPAYTAAKAGLEGLAAVLRMELEGTGVRSTTVRVGPTGTEFGARMDHAVLHETLASWKYWGLQRSLHWMGADAVANAILRVATTPVDESYTTVVEVMPGGRKREPGG